MDEKDVQPETVSPEGGDVSPEVAPEVKSEGDEPKPELTEERVQQLIAEATAKAVTQAEEAGRRNLQSEQDRNKNAERRVRLAESRVKGYEDSFSGLDEETRKDIELAKYREQDKFIQSSAQEEAQRQQETVNIQKMNDSLLEEIKSWGIEPDDKRIDFASDAPDYFTGRKRFTDSLQKIVRADSKKEIDDFRSEMEKKHLQDRIDLGLESVDTTASSGGGSDSDAAFKKGIGDGSLPLNKANMERARKLGLAK